MKKILQINTTSYGSTGKIMRGIASICNKSEIGMQCYCACAYENDKVEDIDYYIGYNHERLINKTLSEYTGKADTFSKFGTKRLIEYIEKLNPDLIHLHNLHGWYLDIPVLFKYLKKRRIPIVWTLHDCWSFTGRCPHFLLTKCDKWKNGCFECSYSKLEYPSTKNNNESYMWDLKKKCFSNIENCTIVTPSKWLAGLVKESFLKSYNIRVINNGIDLDIFRPSNFEYCEKSDLAGKTIVLGVALGWERRKGLDVFIELAKRLDDSYKIVLIGTDEKIDEKLPDNIISIHRTHDQYELAKFYSSSKIFLNPTREDNFPTVNLESLACGTPVITFNTGGSSEMIDDTCGIKLECDDIEGVIEGIYEITNSSNYTSENCINKARMYNQGLKFNEYIDLYKNILK